MNRFTNLTLITIFLLKALIVRAQDEGPISEMFLKGKWHAECPMEVLDQASFQNCELCMFLIDPNNKQMAGISDFEIMFNSDSLTLDQNGLINTIPYTRNKDTHAISFDLNNKSYSFRVFFYNKQRILEDNDGLLLILSKID